MAAPCPMGFFRVGTATVLLRRMADFFLRAAASSSSSSKNCCRRAENWALSTMAPQDARAKRKEA